MYLWGNYDESTTSELKEYCKKHSQDRTDYYVEWRRLESDRIRCEQLRKKIEIELKEHLAAVEKGRVGAYLDIAIGGASIVGSIAVAIYTGGESLGVTSITASCEVWLPRLSLGYSLEMLKGGWTALQSINNGVFQPNKEYKFVKGLIVDNITDETGRQLASFIYDFSAICTSVKSLSGNVENAFVIKGSDLNKMLYSYAAGVDAVSITYGSEDLVFKFK